MKQKSISAVINKRFEKIEAVLRIITLQFEMESIHEFRTEIKKLRAFLHLLNVEIDDNRLKISKKMKTVYGYVGTIRNLQLQLKNMDAYTGSPQYTVTEIYTEYLKKIIEKWKANAIEFIKPEPSFRNDEKKVLKQLPAKLRRLSVKSFLQNKLDELARLVKELPGDDVLHSIRKILKEILYNWPHIKQYNKLLPADFGEEEKIKSFTDLLGLFLDKAIAIILLETYCRDCEENGLFIEKDISELHAIEGGWKREKHELSQIIYLHPGLLNFSPVSL